MSDATATDRHRLFACASSRHLDGDRLSIPAAGRFGRACWSIAALFQGYKSLRLRNWAPSRWIRAR
jgi:hypothetical protein